jgi:serine/threonine protein phosphatase 1
MTLLSRFTRAYRRVARIPDDRRVYAIGDVHGEARLLGRLLRKIAADQAEREPKSITIIFVGDLIDRGPRSDVILQSMIRADDPGVIVLKGNHEQALVDAYRGDDQALESWLCFGGEATLNSFGIEVDLDAWDDFAVLREQMRARIGDVLIDWLDRRPVHCCIGDYFFVHAGIRPGVPLDRQTEEDMLWIREPFIASRREHAKVIVHGHTIERGPVELGGNRINLDTGAHRFGHLSALGLEGDEQWLVDVCASGAAAQPERLREPAFGA